MVTVQINLLLRRTCTVLFGPSLRTHIRIAKRFTEIYVQRPLSDQLNQNFKVTEQESVLKIIYMLLFGPADGAKYPQTNTSFSFVNGGGCPSGHRTHPSFSYLILLDHSISGVFRRRLPTDQNCSSVAIILRYGYTLGWGTGRY